MNILGIESSCDETAAAVVSDGRHIISNVVHSQIDIHAAFGGVVPEIAARSHLEVILPVVDRALSDAALDWDGIDAVAVSHAPGLIGSLLIGTLTAKTIAHIKNKPLIPVHHVEGHIYANFLLEQTPQFPILALVVSGAHSQLVLMRDHGDYELLGQTQDDAVGEAFDKVARMLGLPYPGGPSIERLAADGDPQAFKLPRAKLSGRYDFSFSGLKTAVLRTIQSHVGVTHDTPSSELPALLDDKSRADLAASFAYTAAATLVDKAMLAYHDHQPTSVVIAGGVAASSELRRQLSEKLPIDINYAPISLCTDNAAMIAGLGYYKYLSGITADPLELDVYPTMSMTKTAWKKLATT